MRTTIYTIVLSVLCLILLAVSVISIISLKNDIATLDKDNERLLSIIDSTPRLIEVTDLYAGVNNVRIKRGLSALKIDVRLEISACAKAHDMAAKNYWAHTAPDGTEPWNFISSAGYKYKFSGENLAKEYDSANGAVNAWVNSPTHLENIVGNYSDMGICIIQSNQSQLSGTNNATNVIVNHFGR